MQLSKLYITFPSIYAFLEENLTMETIYSFNLVMRPSQCRHENSGRLG